MTNLFNKQDYHFQMMNTISQVKKKIKENRNKQEKNKNYLFKIIKYTIHSDLTFFKKKEELLSKLISIFRDNKDNLDKFILMKKLIQIKSYLN